MLKYRKEDEEDVGDEKWEMTIQGFLTCLKLSWIIQIIAYSLIHQLLDRCTIQIAVDAFPYYATPRLTTTHVSMIFDLMWCDIVTFLRWYCIIK